MPFLSCLRPSLIDKPERLKVSIPRARQVRRRINIRIRIRISNLRRINLEFPPNQMLRDTFLGDKIGIDLWIVLVSNLLTKGGVAVVRELELDSSAIESKRERKSTLTNSFIDSYMFRFQNLPISLF